MGRVRQIWPLQALVAALPLLALLLPLVAALLPTSAVSAAPAAGAVWSWGHDGEGGLGDGAVAGEVGCSTNCAPTAAPTNGATDFTAISAGGSHSLGLTTAGTVYAWGSDTNGALGDGTVGGGSRPTPTAITGVAGQVFIAVSAGEEFSLALASDGRVWAWGFDGYGALGDGTRGGLRATPAPIAAPSGTVFTAISAGTQHALALASNGVVWSWGYDADGELGDGAAGGEEECGRNCTATPAMVVMPSGVTFTAVEAGYGHSLALASDGKVWSWGRDASGALGDGTVGDDNPTPTEIAMPSGVTFAAVAAGSSHSLALATDGSVWSWGGNGSGELGDGTTGNNNPTPTQVAALSGKTFKAVDGGGNVSLALTTDGKVWSWGRDTGGGLGDGTAGGTDPTPDQIADGGQPPFQAISVGKNFALALTTVTPASSPSASPSASASASASPSAVPDPGFVDVRPGAAGYEAIANLAARGVVEGYQGTPRRFGPQDLVQRMQIAVMVVRALEWQGRTTEPEDFSDIKNPGDEQQRAALILANACRAAQPAWTCVAQGYSDGRFGIGDNVSHAQVIAFIARAFQLDPDHAWAAGTGGAPYASIPSEFADEIATFHANAGAIPDAPTTAAGWSAPASRAWVARVLWQAIQAQP